MLDYLVGRGWYSFLDGYVGYNYISIIPMDQEKTIFTFLYGTFVFNSMFFGLCNAPSTFQHCMMSIFFDIVENTVELFMDDFSVIGDSFDDFLDYSSNALGRCDEKNLVIYWKKCHFMAKKGIVLGHNISEKGIEIDKAKIEVTKK